MTRLQRNSQNCCPHGSQPFFGFDWYYSTIPLIGSQYTERSTETIQYGGRQSDGFVNHAANWIWINNVQPVNKY